MQRLVLTVDQLSLRTGGDLIKHSVSGFQISYYISAFHEEKLINHTPSFMKIKDQRT